MKVFIKHTEFGFQYKEESARGFTYFPEDITTIEKMKRYFINGGHFGIKGGTYNEPTIQFVNQQGTPAVHYTIKSGEKFAGHPFATVNHDPTKKFLFDTSEFVPDSEKLEFLRDHSTRKQDLESDKLESDNEKIKYYLNNVTDSTKAEYKQFIDEKLTPDVLKDLCLQNAKTYNLPGEVEFLSEAY